MGIRHSLFPSPLKKIKYSIRPDLKFNFPQILAISPTDRARLKMGLQSLSSLKSQFFFTKLLESFA